MSSPCREGPDGRDSYGVGWVPELGKRTFPFIMAAVNTRVVRRSNALLGHAYGASRELGQGVNLTRAQAVYFR